MTKERIRTLPIYKESFDLIDNGSKTIEVRVAYDSMKRIAVGDVIQFTSRDNAQCKRKVIRVATYKSFDEMMATEDPKKINPIKSAQAQLAYIKNIFPPHKEKLGVLIFELQNC